MIMNQRIVFNRNRETVTLSDKGIEQLQDAMKDGKARFAEAETVTGEMVSIPLKQFRKRSIENSKGTVSKTISIAGEDFVKVVNVYGSLTLAVAHWISNDPNLK